MVARKKGKISLLTEALQAEREAVEFFGRSQTVTQDPSVRQIFEKLTKEMKLHVKNLEEIMEKLDLSAPELKAPSGFYPISDLQRAECYVCGYAADAESIPESCPRCGASRYAFEKEISGKKAWEFAEKGAVAILRMLGEAERGADARMRSMMAGHIRLEQQFLSEARKQIEALKK